MGKPGNSAKAIRQNQGKKPGVELHQKPEPKIQKGWHLKKEGHKDYRDKNKDPCERKHQKVCAKDP